MKGNSRRKGSSFGFVRVAAATPRLKLGNPLFNAQETVKLLAEGEKKGVRVVFFPELGLTGYTCADLFHQTKLLQGAVDGLARIVEATRDGTYSGIAFVGMPLLVDGNLFNCAVGVTRGEVIGVVPKTFLVNNGEFYEWRWFTPADEALTGIVTLLGKMRPFGTDILFACHEEKNLIIGIDICEDVWALNPPSNTHVLYGATIIGNLSASPEMVGKAEYRKQLITMRSATGISAYVYTSSGVDESTTDLVFGGNQIIAENGSILAENKRFQRKAELTVSDIDLERLVADRMRIKNFADSKRLIENVRPYRRANFSLGNLSAPEKLERSINAHPFVPRNSLALNERCEEIFSIQVAGLSKRLEQLWRVHEPNCPVRLNSGREDTSEFCSCESLRKDGAVHIGVSGGRDSTLALVAACRAMDLLGVPRTCIHGTTMPGFGTTDRTKRDAVALMEQLEISIDEEQDIRFACLEEWRRTGHKPFGRIDVAAVYKAAEKKLDGAFSFEKFEKIVLELFEEELKKIPPGSQDLVFENTQARRRTEILMNKGFVLGTGDLSELAQGWCTYNADHMSMYNVNTSIPKTLVNFLIKWVAETLTEGALQATLLSVIASKISPELLPKGKDGEIAQDTEESIGPYELTDFFLYYLLRLGYAPEKILYLATQAVGFERQYAPAIIEKWLKVFIQRFFRNQFKRSCLPDGPKVGSICLSPRGDWRMPSDADESLWLGWASETSNEDTARSSTERDTTLTKAKQPKVLRVLLRVDPNKCFMPGGPLGVAEGDQIITPLNALSRSGYYDLVIDSSDEHGDKQVSFACNHDGKKAGDAIEMYGFTQLLWLKHGTPETGREFHPDLDVSMVAHTVRKGTDDRVDSYSAFYDNGRQASDEVRAKYPFLGKSTGLAEYITDEAEKGGFDEIQLDGGGLALGFCVSWSLKDARSQTYKGKKWQVRLLQDCTRAIEFKDGDYDRYIEELEADGIEIVQSGDVLQKVASSN